MVGRNLFILSVLLVYCVFRTSSEFITKCKSDDPKCMKKSTQAVISVFANGLPEYNVKKMDPISFKRIDASTPNLKLILTDITITGLKDCVAKKVTRDKSKNKLSGQFLCSCQLESQYEMDGQLLIIPITGKGPLHVTLRKIELSIEADMGEIVKEGVVYWDIKDWKHSFTLKGKSEVVFENLFDGNKILAQAANDVVSNGGNEIVLDAGPPIIKEVLTELANNVNNFFHSIPAHDLSID